MRKKYLSIITSMSLLALTGCTTQTLKPAEVSIEPGEVCIVPDNSPRKVAYNVTIEGLKEKGFTVKEVTWDKIDECPDLVNMQSKFRWDMAYFASDLHLKYARKGEVITESKYHCVSGLNFTKFINTREKVYDMLNKMMPTTRKLESRYERQSYGTMPLGKIQPEEDEAAPAKRDPAYDEIE